MKFDSMQAPARLRTPSRSANAAGTTTKALDSVGAELISRLPSHVSLLHTASDFPHVLNRLGTLWWQPEAFQEVLAGLLVDARPRRQGFPGVVIAELASLQRHHATQVAPRLLGSPPP